MFLPGLILYCIAIKDETIKPIPQEILDNAQIILPQNYKIRYSSYRHIRDYSQEWIVSSKNPIYIKLPKNASYMPLNSKIEDYNSRIKKDEFKIRNLISCSQ